MDWISVCLSVFALFMSVYSVRLSHSLWHSANSKAVLRDNIAGFLAKARIANMSKSLDTPLDPSTKLGIEQTLTNIELLLSPETNSRHEAFVRLLESIIKQIESRKIRAPERFGRLHKCASQSARSLIADYRPQR